MKRKRFEGDCGYAKDGTERLEKISKKTLRISGQNQTTLRHKLIDFLEIDVSQRVTERYLLEWSWTGTRVAKRVYEIFGGPANKSFLRTFATHRTAKEISSTLDSSLRPRIHLFLYASRVKSLSAYANKASKSRVPIRNLHKLYR